MRRLIPLLVITLALGAFAQQPGDPELVAGSDEPWRELPDHILLHVERQDLLFDLETDQVKLEDVVEELTAAVADPFEEPALRTELADRLFWLGAEVEVDGVTIEEPQALGAALAAAVADDPDWVRGYLTRCFAKDVFYSCRLLELMAVPTAIPLFDELARDANLDFDLRLSAVRAIGAAEGQGAYDRLTALIEDPAMPDQLRVEAMTALAPIGYDEGRAFLEGFIAETDSSRLAEGAAAALELLEETASMTTGAWIMLALGFILLFGGAVFFVIIAVRRSTPHVFSDDSDEGEEDTEEADQ